MEIQKMSKTKRILITAEEEFHRKCKQKAVKNGQSLTEIGHLLFSQWLESDKGPIPVDNIIQDLRKVISKLEQKQETA
jgi:hypothetical protein